MNVFKKMTTLFLMIFLCGTLTAATKTINFVTDKEKDGGFLLAITKEAFSRVGYTVNVEYLPWARALNNVMTGESEALLGAQYTDERAKNMAYSNLVGESPMVFFKMKSNNISYNKLQDLSNYTIGTIVNSAYTSEFDSATYLKKVAVSDFTSNIKNLIGEKIQLFVEKKYVVLNAIKTQFPNYYGKIDYLPKPLKEMKFYNTFSKKSPDYQQKLNDFNKGLDMIKKDGTFDKIMDKDLHE